MLKRIFNKLCNSAKSRFSLVRWVPRAIKRERMKLFQIRKQFGIRGRFSLYKIVQLSSLPFPVSPVDPPLYSPFHLALHSSKSTA